MVGAWAMAAVEELGAMTLFAGEVLRIGFRKRIPWASVVDQMYEVGVRSLPVTLMAGGFVGGIMAIQINLQLVDFGAQSFLGGLSTSVTIRDVGPVIIAFMLSGRVGAYTSAELGTMRITEQMDAIRCLGANPIEMILWPRMIAVVLSSFLLLVTGLMISLVGGIMVSSLGLAINPIYYLLNIPKVVTGFSLVIGILKSLVLGILIGVICCYQGYSASGGAIQVGQKVKRAAVQSMVAIIVADFGVSVAANFFLRLFHMGEL